MEAISPSPISSPSAIPPVSQQNATSPSTSTPPQSPPTNVTSPPPAKPPTSPPQRSSPPPPPPQLAPPPSSPPPPSSTPPSTSPSPPANPPSSDPPTNSPPPSQSRNPPPPPAVIPPKSSSPPPPPPPSSQPPKTSPPPPISSSPPLPVTSSPRSLPNTPRSSPADTPPPASTAPAGSRQAFPQPVPPTTSGGSPSGSSLPSSSSLPTNSTSSINTSSNSRPTRGGSTGGNITIGLIFGFLLLGSIGIFAWCIWKRKKKNTGSNSGHVLPTYAVSSPESPNPDSLLLKMGSSATNIRTGSENSRSWFTFEELLEATNGFASENLLGEGGFGCVYKGHLPDKREVAVKQLKIGGGQGEREFRAEVEIISRVHHRHLVSLVGYCISENRRMLVYEYIPNNNLYFHLHGNCSPVIDWATHIKIAVGAARGIAYLHEDCYPRIVHRDIKSSNILLDDNFEARVSDFGLAKLFEDTNTHITTRVMGTFGYMAPEYASSGKLTEKSDVFSFGVVLLELITGRKPVDESQPPGEESLVEWARPLLSRALECGEYVKLIDERIQKNYVDSDILRVIEIAAACVRHSSIKRPQMGQVVRAFESMETCDLSNGMRVGESEIVNPLHSEQMRLFHRMAFGIQDFSTGFFDQTSPTG